MKHMKYYNQEDFPDSIEYQCPPKEAKQFQGKIYRFSKKVNNKTDSKDWISDSKIKNAYNKWSSVNNYELMCQSSGYSCFLSEKQAKTAFNEMTKKNKALKKKFKSLYYVAVNKTDGVLLDTTNPKKEYEHFTFWMSCKSDIATHHFQVTKLQA